MGFCRIKLLAPKNKDRTEGVLGFLCVPTSG